MDYISEIKKRASKEITESYFLDHLSKMASEDKGMSALAFDCLKDIIKIMTPEQRETVKNEWEEYFSNDDEFKKLMEGETSRRLEGVYEELQTSMGHK